MVENWNPCKRKNPKNEEEKHSIYIRTSVISFRILILLLII
jgi:hypothetical protein